MNYCVICNKELSDGVFNNKDKFELFGHSFICRECANKVGIKNMWKASTYNSEKVKKLYFEKYPEEINNYRDKNDLDEQHVLKLYDSESSKDRLQAINYVKENGAMGTNEAISYLDKTKKEDNDIFYKKIKEIPNSNITWTKKEIMYLRKILFKNEEVLDVVSGIVNQNDITVSGNSRELAAQTNDSARTWLMALTNKRIILINRHLLVGTEYMEISLEKINSISYQSRLLLSSISIMHASGGIVINNIAKGCEKPFVDRTNQAMDSIKSRDTNQIVEAINNINSNSKYSVADELKKFKELLDIGAITQDEFDKKKKELLG